MISSEENGSAGRQESIEFFGVVAQVIVIPNLMPLGGAATHHAFADFIKVQLHRPAEVLGFVEAAQQKHPVANVFVNPTQNGLPTIKIFVEVD